MSSSEAATLDACMDAAREEDAACIESNQELPAFLVLRALAIEAYYSDFACPGYDGPTRKDWSFLRCYR